MSASVESAVSAAVSLDNLSAMQQKQNLLLRKVLDNQANTIANLIGSATGPQQLAKTGSVGTFLHVAA